MKTLKIFIISLLLPSMISAQGSVGDAKRVIDGMLDIQATCLGTVLIPFGGLGACNHVTEKILKRGSTKKILTGKVGKAYIDALRGIGYSSLIPVVGTSNAIIADSTIDWICRTYKLHDNYGKCRKV